MRTYTLKKQPGLPLYESLYRAIREDILTGALQPGEKLPSKRALASNLEVGKTTVEGAYNQLLEEGYISSRERSGYFVEAVEQRQAELEASQKEELASLIESEMETYISDKAKSMSLTLRVQVTAEPDGSGVPVPVRAELTGPRSEELSRWLDAELGLPAERQVWNEN